MTLTSSFTVKMPLNKNLLVITVAFIAVVITGAIIFVTSSAKLQGSNVLSFLKVNSGGSAKDIGQKSVDYLNKNVLQQGQTATLGDVSEVGGVIKMQIKIGTNTYDSYATKDGKLLFPEAFNLDQAAGTNTQNAQPQPSSSASLAKADTPSLDVFVVSRCPYGLQMQRAIADAVKNVPLLASYINVRYIGAVSGKTITSMHGEAEATENLRQICIREEQPNLYWSYVACQMKSGDTAGCQAEARVDAVKLNACIKDPSRGLAYAQKDFDLQAKYGIQGSPTLVLNQTQISEDTFGGRSADAVKNMICQASNSPPAFCSTKLNTVPAATSFSLTYAGAGNAVASAGTNCAPATN